MNLHIYLSSLQLKSTQQLSQNKPKSVTLYSFNDNLQSCKVTIPPLYLSTLSTLLTDIALSY